MFYPHGTRICHLVEVRGDFSGWHASIEKFDS
jgi:hypothetical protein